jgi:predicted Abi (CAAX) family protease
MARRKSGSLTADYPLAVNLLVMVLLALFILICSAGALKGLAGVQKHERGDFMSPIWFVASALGAVTCTILFAATLTSLLADRLTGLRRRSQR